MFPHIAFAIKKEVDPEGWDSSLAATMLDLSPSEKEEPITDDCDWLDALGLSLTTIFCGSIFAWAVFGNLLDYIK